MYLTSAKGYKNAGVHFLRVRKTGEIWSSIFETKNLTKKQIRKYKMTAREIFEKYANLSEDELSEKSNKNVYIKNDVITTVIKRCGGGKKKEVKKKKKKKK